MNKEEFDALFKEKVENIYTHDLSEEAIMERVNDFSDDSGKMDLSQIVQYLSREQRLYTNWLISDVFHELIDRGYLK